MDAVERQGIARLYAAIQQHIAAEQIHRRALYLEWHSHSEYAQRKVAGGLIIDDDQADYLEQQVAASRRQDHREGHD